MNVWVQWLFIISILCLLVYTYILARKQILLEAAQKEPPRFSTDIQLDPFPENFDVSGIYDCNATSLKECLVDDPTTLFGCKELLVRCVHFEKDTEYLNDGNSTMIPANATPNDGYALPVTNLASACNPYHGDLVLVSLDSDSTEYMMICSCKNPGYIGNLHILDSCENVFICNGKIDDINRPLDEINCICDDNQASFRYDLDGVPVCKILTVSEANKLSDDWSSMVPWIHDRLLTTSAFSRTIADNVKSSVLLDPCRSSIHDMSVEIPGGKYNNQGTMKSCTFRNYGIPLESHMFDPIPNPAKGTPFANVNAGLATELVETLRFSDNIAGERKIASVKTKIPLISSDLIRVPLPRKIAIGNTRQLMIDALPSYYSWKCEGNWPYYDCPCKEYYNHLEYGVPYPGSRRIPDAFVSKKSFWYDAEYMTARGLKFEESGLYLTQDDFLKIPDTKSYGIQLVSFVKEFNSIMEMVTWRGANPSGIISITNDNDYRLHKAAVT